MSNEKTQAESVASEQQTGPAPGKVLGAIRRVADAIGKKGIDKTEKNSTQNFMFRGIDNVMTELSPLLAKERLIIVPRYAGREVREYTTKTGTRMASVSLVGVYRVISTEDSSGLDFGPFYGEGMDSGDKATNKAMSIAFKYFFIQAFVIPIVGNDDPDFESHEPAGKGPVAGEQQPVAETQQSASKNPIQLAIEKATKNTAARRKLAKMIADAYEVVALDDIPADKRVEALQRLTDYLAKQAQKKSA